MAEFRGVFPALPVVVAPCGLLSVAMIQNHGGDAFDSRWVRGYEFETLVTPTVRILNRDDNAVTGGTVYDNSGDVDHFEVEPFFIEVEKLNSGMGLAGETVLENTKEQIEAATQKALEYELWEGVATQAGTSDSPYLIRSGAAAVVTSSGEGPARALELLEQSIAGSPVGGRGVIHMTRDVASALGSRLLFRKSDGESNGYDYAITRLGTLVVIGSGYTGNGPIGETGAAASDTNKWMFATGTVVAHLGEAEIVNDSLSQGFNTATNDSIVKAIRSAAVHFDPSIYSAAQVTLS